MSKKYFRRIRLAIFILAFLETRFPVASSFIIPRGHSSRINQEELQTLAMSTLDRCLGDPHVENVLFIECGEQNLLVGPRVDSTLLALPIAQYYFPCHGQGFGNDSHGQNATKAAGKVES